MTTPNATAPTAAQSPSVPSTDTADADLRRSLEEEKRDAILEYLTELVPIGDVIYSDQDEETMHRGRVAVRRLANGSAKVLSPPECADVLALLSHSEPRKPIPTDGIGYMGYISLMGTLEAAVRRALKRPNRAEGAPAATPRVDALPSAIQEHLETQQRRAMELRSLLEMLDESIEEDNGVLGIAVREAFALDNALDMVTLGRVLRGEPSAPTSEAASTEAPAAIVPDREPVSAATVALLDAINDRLTRTSSSVTVLVDALDDDHADQRFVLMDVLDQLKHAGESVEYAGMGLPQKAPLWPGDEVEDRARLREEALAAVETEGAQT